MHKSGFVNIIGNPNVGKSTLMNALVGEKLSIITSKAQTTRHRILGIVNGDDFQIVFSDTPGILKPCYKLQESMMNFVRGALSDADVLLYVTDTVERDDERAAEIIDRIRQSGVPTLVVVNKIDLTTQERSKRSSRSGARRCPTPKSYRSRPGKDSTSPACSTGFWRCCPKANPSTRRIRSRTRRCVSSPRRSSAKRSCATTTRRSLTAAKSRSRSTARSPASTAFRP